MIQLCDAKDCTGCMACGNACRHSAITFVVNEEGFLHPKINHEACIGCKMCVRACPILTPCPPAGTQEEKRVFAAWSKDKKIREESSSGGVFSELARNILARGGVVFGAAFDEDFKLHHIGIDDEKDLEKLRGSKYVQSEIGDSFAKAERLLKSGRGVLFSGTPCQIAGLRMYLRKSYENLLTVDIVCHGVPSPMVFRSYKEWLESQLGAPLGTYKFRDKRWSWKNFNTKAIPLWRSKSSTECFLVEEKTGAFLGTWQEDPWMRGFLREYFLREACHSCRYTNTDRPADITLADYWGYCFRIGFRDDDKGISMVMLNSLKGRDAFERIKSGLVFCETPIVEAVRGNPALSRCFAPSPLRAVFWEDFKAGGYAGTLKKYMYPEPIRWHLRILYRYGRNHFVVEMLRGLLFALALPRRSMLLVWRVFKPLKIMLCTIKNEFVRGA